VAIFVLYFEVIQRIGAEKAAYATVLFPLVALVVSTFAEDHRWTPLALAGVPLALAGNALVLWRGRAGLPAPGGGAPGQAQPIEWPVHAVDLPEDGTGRAHGQTQDPLFPGQR